MNVTRGQILIGALLVTLVLGSVGAVTLTLIIADGQAATLVGVVMLVLTTVIPSFLSIMQGMTNAGKVDVAAAKLDVNTAATLDTNVKVANIHDTVVPLVDRLTREP